ncbi:MAG TPA: hypothetical protein VFV43_09090 [Limnobacter sp.]|nr:hypothetical protein [Limnobacter sp.]
MKKQIRGAIRSLTVQFNALMGCVIVALPDLMQAMPAFQEFMGEDAYKKLSAILVLGNILLRGKTNKPLAER